MLPCYRTKLTKPVETPAPQPEPAAQPVEAKPAKPPRKKATK